MKINVTPQITTLHNQPIKGPDGQPMTLRSASADALVSALPGDDQLSGTVKAAFFATALKVMSDDVCELTAEEIASIKKRVAAMFAPLIIGRVYALLEAASNQ